VVSRVANGGRDWVVILVGKPKAPVSLPAREWKVVADAPRPTPSPVAAVPPMRPTPPPVRLPPVVTVRAVAASAVRTRGPAPALRAGEGPQGDLPRPVPAPERGSATPGPVVNRADARQALEALRLGVVPPRGLSRLTVGRDAEQARIQGLVRKAGGMLVLSGGYGAGKTHLVELAEAEALANNMLVARASFDPVEVPPSHPLRVYSALMTGLRYPEGTGRGLAPLLDRLTGSSAHCEPGGTSAHRWLTPALWAQTRFAGGTLAADLLTWVEGGADEKAVLDGRLRGCGYPGKMLLSLPDYRTFGQVMAYLLGGIATWARDAGWSGFLVLLDEAEYFEHLETTSREMAENVLRYLAMGALPDSDLPFHSGSVYRGGHPIYKEIPPRFAPDQPLSVLCAFTPNRRIDAALAGIVSKNAMVHLDPIAASTFPQLAENVLGMVREAHPDLAPPQSDQLAVSRALAAAWEDGRATNTRQAARMLVEFWDLYRLSPERARRSLG
ncbi:MAG: hypothetical protein EXR69_09725, partial [Myxococcales bacterium]|nr:hypothetical protein [Myxococcales bacterium]